MISTGIAVNYFSRKLKIKRRGGESPDDYDEEGNLIESPEIGGNLKGSIQPARGRDYQDMPEGARAEASHILSTTGMVQNNDIIIDDKYGDRYKVVHLFRATLGQYKRAALGLLADER